MHITLKPKKSFYQSFPEYANKSIEFIAMERDDNCGGGYRVKVTIGEEFIGDFSNEYFTFNFK
jgi:hypothetical protein